MYFTVYISFLPPGHQKEETTRICNYGAAVTAVCLGYSWFEDPALVEFRYQVILFNHTCSVTDISPIIRYGMVITCLGLMLMASPLLNLVSTYLS